MEKLVSVMIPIYNVEPYLKKCVDSVLNQTYKNIEVILVDDGSEDTSPKICDEYAREHDNIKVVHKKNAGLGMARNTGLEKVSGDYVTFVDGDDFIDCDHIEQLLRNIIENNSDASFGGYKRQIGKVFIEQINAFSGHVLKNDEIINDFVPRMCGKLNYNIVDEVQMSVCMNLYSMQIISENDIRFFSERELISEDFIFNLDFLENANCISVSKTCGYNYRDNANSLTKIYNPDRLKKQIKFTNYIIERTHKMGIYSQCEQRIFSTFLQWVRNILKSEQARYKQVGMKNSLLEIKKICNERLVLDALAVYDDSNLQRKASILNKLIRRKRYILIWIFSFFKEIFNA